MGMLTEIVTLKWKLQRELEWSS